MNALICANIRLIIVLADIQDRGISIVSEVKEWYQDSYN